MVTLLIVFMLLLGAGVGFGFDFGRALREKSDAQAVADAMALAMAQVVRFGGTEEEARDAAMRIFDAHFPSGRETPTLSFGPEDKVTGRTTTAAIAGSTRMTLSRLLRKSTVNWLVDATARVSIERLELAILIDVSPAIEEKQKVAELRDSLTDLMDVIIPYLLTGVPRLVSILPFAESLHFGYLYRDWLESAQRTAFKGCFTPASIQDRVDNILEKKGAMKSFPDEYVSIAGNRRYPCPRSTSEVRLYGTNPMGGDFIFNELAYAFGYGRGTDIALSWGWRVVSPSWRGFFRTSGGIATLYPRDFSPSNPKIVLLITHGYPIRYDFAADGLNKSGYVDGKREPGTDSERTALATEYLRLTCEAIRSEGEVKVFVVGYDMPAATDNAQRNALRVLEECPSNGGIFLAVPYGGMDNAITRLIGEFRQVRLEE